MRFGRKLLWLPIRVVLFNVALCFVVGCVTYTERISPYESIPRDESLWDEIRREFSWRKNEASFPPEESQTSFYQSMKETVSGWFNNQAEQLNEREIEADRRRFERQRQGALQRLQDQQQLNEVGGDEDGD